MSEMASKAEKFLEGRAGWAQFILTIGTSVALVSWAAGKVSSSQEQQARQIEQYTASQNQAMQNLTNRIDHLSEQVTRLAISNERIAEATDDTKRRLNRLEDQSDGKHR